MENFFKSQRYSFYFWAGSLLLFALGSLFLLEVLFAEQLSWQTIGREEIANLQYDSRSSNPGETRVKEYVETRHAGKKEVQIQFDLKVYFFEEGAVVFQTAPKNQGLRLELSRPSGVRLAFPYGPWDLTKPIPLADFLKVGEWVSVKISLNREKRLLVYLNQVQVTDLTDSGIDFDITNINVGRTEKRSRELDGAIRDFHMEYRLLDTPAWLSAGRVALKILLLSGLAALIGIRLGRRAAWADWGQWLPRLKSSHFFILLGCWGGFAAFSFLYADFLSYELLKEGKINHPLFDCRSEDPAISQTRAFSGVHRAEIQDIQIDFDMKVYSLSYYSNIFQTAGGNSGLRMELSAPSTLFLLIGVQGPAELKAVPITQSLRLHEWYAVKIRADQKKNLKIYLNEVLVFKGTDPSIQYSISDVAIGTGFSRSRPFDGAIKNFRMEYHLFGRRSILPFCVSLLDILLGCAVVIYLAGLLMGSWGCFLKIGWLLQKALPWIRQKGVAARSSSPWISFLVIILSIGLLGLLHAYPDDFQYETIRRQTLSQIQYDFGSEDSGLSSRKKFFETSNSSFREIAFQLDLKAYSLADSGAIFQTAVGDAGLRLEVGQPSKLLLFIGSGGGRGPGRITLTDALRLNEWYRVEIQIDRKKNLKAFLNGRPVGEYPVPSAEYAIADLTVGGGSGNSRPFDGAIADFNLEYGLINKNHRVFNVILGAKILLALLLLFGVARIGLFLIPRVRIRTGFLETGFIAGMLALLLVTFLYGDFIANRGTKEGRVSQVQLDTRSPESGLAEVKEVLETSPGRVQKLDLHFQMKVYSIQEFDNVFQTADGNQGIRMELHTPRSVALVFRDRSRDEVKGILLTDSLEFDRWYSVRMFRDPSERLKVYWEGDLVADISDARIGYEVSNIAVGTGFSRSRPLDGAIRDFTLEYQLQEERPQARGVILALQCLSLFGLAGSLCRILIRILGRRNLPEFLLRVRLFSILLLLGSGAQLLFFLVNHFHYGLSYPFTSPLFVPPDRFMDFFNINFRSVMDTRYTEYSAICPPFGFLTARYFSLFADYGSGPFAARDQVGGWISLGIYLAIFFLSIGVLARRLARTLEEKGIPPWPLDGGLFFLAVLLSYPVWNAVDRGNYIILGFTFFYWILYVPAWRNQVSAFSLAGLISLKAHLGIYLLLLADRYHWRKFVDTLFWLLFLNLIASVILQDFNFLLRIVENYGKFSTHFHPASKIFNSPSLFSVLYLLFHERMSPSGFASLERIYAGLSLAGLILLAFWVRKKINDLNLRFFYLTLGFILLPVASFDYNLILILVFVPYLLSLPEGEFSRMEVALLTLVLIPKHYLTFYLEPYPTQLGETYLRLTEQVLFTPLLLLALLIIRLVRPALRPSAGGTAWTRIQESFRRAVYPRNDQALENSPGISSMNSCGRVLKKH